VLAHHVGISRLLFSELLDDASEFGKKEWDYLWRSVTPPTVHGSLEVDESNIVVLFIESDHPKGIIIQYRLSVGCRLTRV
jgi:hypothetical protein